MEDQDHGRRNDKGRNTDWSGSERIAADDHRCLRWEENVNRPTNSCLAFLSETPCESSVLFTWLKNPLSSAEIRTNPFFPSLSIHSQESFRSRRSKEVQRSASWSRHHVVLLGIGPQLLPDRGQAPRLLWSSRGAEVGKLLRTIS
jgi:hypothetical protein